MSTYKTNSVERLSEIRQRIVDTLLEIDNVKLQVNPRILAEYAKTIGYLENDLYKWQLMSRRCKRKFALVQASVNRLEPVSMSEINDTLDDEFAEWEAQLAVMVSDQLQILETLTGSQPLSPSEARELKALHKKLIKRLHPDIHPNLPEDAHRFFLIAQSAYENGDVDTLRAVDTATEDYEEDVDETVYSEDDAELELVMAEAQLNIACEQLDVLKRSHPYILLNFIRDPIALMQRKSELESEIERHKGVAKAYESKIASLLGGERR